MSATFYDALSGEKRRLNIRERRQTPSVEEPWCQGSLKIFKHVFSNMENDFDKCMYCDMTIIRLRALNNLKKK